MQPIPSECNTCGAPMYWARTRDGKAIPIDVKPTPKGNILLTYNQSRDDLNAKVYAPNNTHNIPPGRNRYTSHFATCPDADKHRRR